MMLKYVDNLSTRFILLVLLNVTPGAKSFTLPPSSRAATSLTSRSTSLSEASVNISNTSTSHTVESRDAPVSSSSAVTIISASNVSDSSVPPVPSSSTGVTTPTSSVSESSLPSVPPPSTGVTTPTSSVSESSLPSVSPSSTANSVSTPTSNAPELDSSTIPISKSEPSSLPFETNPTTSSVSPSRVSKTGSTSKSSVSGSGTVSDARLDIASDSLDASDYLGDSKSCFSHDTRWSSPCGVHVQKRHVFDDDLTTRLDGIQLYINDSIENYIFQQYIKSGYIKDTLQQNNVTVFSRNFDSRAYQDKLTAVMSTLYTFVANTGYLRSCGLTAVAEDVLSQRLGGLITMLYQSLCTAEIAARTVGLQFTAPPAESLLSETLRDWSKSGTGELQQVETLYIAVRNMETVTGKMKACLMQNNNSGI